MKARRVKGLRPAAPLADNAERIVRERLSELCDFMPTAADPAEVEALHDMRIAAKRLRYILEVTAPCFGPYAKPATKLTKDLQDLLGEIHDCDEMLPRVRAHLDALLESDATALCERAAGKKDLDPKLVAKAPSLDAYSGLTALLVHLQARRGLLFGRFLELWIRYQRDGFRARLEFAIAERSEPPPAVEESARAAEEKAKTPAAKKAPAETAPPKSAPVKKAPKETAPAKPAPAEKAPAEPAAAKRAPAKKAPAKPAARKAPQPSVTPRTARRRPARRSAIGRASARPTELPGQVKDPSPGVEPPGTQG